MNQPLQAQPRDTAVMDVKAKATDGAVVLARSRRPCPPPRARRVADRSANGHYEPRTRSNGEAGPADDPIALTREIVRDLPDLNVLRIEDDSMRDALVHRGDVVLLQPDSTAANGELVALHLQGQTETKLRRIHFENGHVRLQPEDCQQEPYIVAPGSFTIQGRVVAIIRQHR